MTAKKLRADGNEDSGRDLEQDLRRLEKIVEALEQGEVPLEKALKLYEEGILLSKSCTELLQKAELRIKTITKEANGKIKADDLE